jgi:hypothetical protein
MASYWPRPYARENNPIVAEQTNNLPKVVGLIAIARWMPTIGAGKSGLIEHSQLALVT